MTLWKCAAIAFAVFVLCCLTIVFASATVSESKFATFLVLGLACVSMLAWPIFAVRALRAQIERIADHVEENERMTRHQ